MKKVACRELACFLYFIFSYFVSTFDFLFFCWIFFGVKIIFVCMHVYKRNLIEETNIFNPWWNENQLKFYLKTNETRKGKERGNFYEHVGSSSFLRDKQELPYLQ